MGCKVNEAVNGWFTSLVRDAVNPAFRLVGQSLLSSPPPSMLARVQELAGHVALVANALLVLFVLAGGLIVMSYGSVQTSTTVKEVAPRLVVAAILVNGSLLVCERAIELANALVEGLLGDGVDPQRAGDLLAGKVLALVTNSTGAVIYLVLMAGTAVLMGTILAFIAVIRITLLLFLMIAAPLALLFHALPQTEGIARLWWRCFFGVLAIQVLQALVLILAFKVQLTQPEAHSHETVLTSGDSPVAQAADVLILIGLLYVLIRIPGWVARTIWQQAQPRLVMRLVRTFLLYKSLGVVGGLFRGSRGAGAAATLGSARKSSTSVSHMGGQTRPGLALAAGPGPSGSGVTTQPTPSPGAAPANRSLAPASSSRGQQLALPIPLPVNRGKQGTQLALPFPVQRVPRPQAPPAPRPRPTTWVRPKPPWVQDRLPGMPTRRPRPVQLRLRLELPPDRKGGRR
ncbi:hypothetical protein ACQP1V_09070 [Microtetraspora malaysiensis]|uniref:hypothetical protein n=1 Tax=Microtetraspora malaysiensis TaxID=161358 RepID=UPI003D93C684